MLAIYALTVGVLLRLGSKLIYRTWLSPLRLLPGPRLSSLTNLWLIWHEFVGNRRLYIHELHQKYGPTVRIGPDEVSFASSDAAKEIYTSAGSGYDRSVFHGMFGNFGTSNMFSTLGKTEHSTKKKRFADRYTKSFVSRPEITSGIQERAMAFIAKCTGTAGQSADIYVRLHCYALDCITHHLFHPFGTDSISHPQDLKKMQELSFQDSLKGRIIEYRFPFLFKVLEYLKTPFLNKRIDGLVSPYVLEVTRKPDLSTIADYTVLSKLRSHKDPLSDLEIASECMDHLVAGIDTTGDGLCFLMWRLSLPDAVTSIQPRLRAELVGNDHLPLDELPYLDAVVKEGLRCFPPIPMSLPRVVPEGGRVIDGAFVPGGTVVSCQAYTMHLLDEEVFPRPNEFIPERWLDEDSAVERNRMFFAFASGGRGCIGKHLALLEMKVLLKEVYSKYQTRVAPEMKASMEISDQILSSRPRDQTCLVVFEKRLP